MGISIDDIIYFAECLKNNYTIDFNNMESFCEAVINTMQKYQMIQETIYQSSKYGTMAEDCTKLARIREILEWAESEVEDGNDD